MMILLGISIVLLCAFIQSATIAMMRALLHRAYLLIPGHITNARPHVLETLVFGSMLTLVFVGILAQGFIWACVFVFTGELSDLGTAFYFSLVNFTTLGYGDIVLSSDRAILGPMQASNGILTLGISTSFLYSVGEKVKAEREKAQREHP